MLLEIVAWLCWIFLAFSGYWYGSVAGQRIYYFGHTALVIMTFIILLKMFGSPLTH